MALKPGSTAWLLAHEMRLTWRRALSRSLPGEKQRSMLGVWIVAGIALILLGVTAGIPVALLLQRFDIVGDPLTILVVDLSIVVLFSLMLSQTLSAATVAFYERGDLDLLLSSPLPAERMLAVRALAMAANVLILALILFSPFLIPVGLIAHPRWLAAYGVLAALGLLASNAGIWLAMALFSVLGPRRTRTIAQVVAALIGAIVFLVSQSYNILGRGGTMGLLAELRGWAASPWFAPNSPLAWPARAVFGEVAPLLAVFSISLAVFGLTTWSLGRRFADNAAAAAGSTDPVRRGRDRADRISFEGGPFIVLVRKEMRLLGRDPTLLSQVLMQILYLAPLGFLLVRNAAAHQLLAVATGAGGIVFLSGQLAGSLGWITISGEDAPDLLTCAPVTPGQMRQAKIAAVLIPVFALLALPLAGLWTFNPWAAAISLAGCLLTAGCTAMIELWLQRPGKRSEFRRRRAGGGAIIVQLIEVGVGLFFGIATGMAVAGWIWALIPLAIGAAIVFAAKPRKAGAPVAPQPVQVIS